MNSSTSDHYECCLFAIELYSPRPQELVDFYKNTLAVKFTRVDFPFEQHIARLGDVSLIINGQSATDGTSDSVSGRATLCVLSRNEAQHGSTQHYLHSGRPLGRYFPERYAERVVDPDGNYIAIASIMEGLRDNHAVPRINTPGDLIRINWKFAMGYVKTLRRSARSVTDSVADFVEYSTDQVTYVRERSAGYTHVVASREGLFIVNERSYKRILRGAFFGATVNDDCLYCFQSCGRIGMTDNRGRILKMTLRENGVYKVDVLVKGLDDGCHQIDFIGDHLFVVDCYNSRVIQISPNTLERVDHYPLGKLSRNVSRGQYHINSIAGHPDGTLWLLLHNNLQMPSEVLVLDKTFRICRRFTIDAGGAHNIVFTNDDSQFLIADSIRGRLINRHGVVAGGDMMMTRGLSLDENMCVIGDSFFSTRAFRRYVPGRVHFFDRKTWTRKSVLSLPAAPTEIRRLDGKDFSISNHLIRHVRAEEESSPPPQ